MVDNLHALIYIYLAIHTIFFLRYHYLVFVTIAYCPDCFISFHWHKLWHILDYSETINTKFIYKKYISLCRNDPNNTRVQLTNTGLAVCCQCFPLATRADVAVSIGGVVTLVLTHGHTGRAHLHVCKQHPSSFTGHSHNTPSAILSAPRS